jgi:antitoxin (DNA-binding transcriptional repressor) of toxin-antitoxin stability system
MSNLTPINASEARNNFFKILEEVYKTKKGFEIRKAGITVARLFGPARSTSKAKMKDFKKVIDKHFGSMPNFPEVHKMRYSKKRDVSW